MTADFVTYDLAVKLKEKGFKWNQITTYNPKTKVRNNHIEPTISQVLKWLREEKNIHVSSVLWYKGWYVDIQSFTKEIDEERVRYYVYNEFQSIDYETYEEAVIAGVNYCLENLI